MRFEELSYRVGSLPVTVSFHPRLTVVGPLGGRARSGWIERVLGVLGGTRPGDGATLVFADHAGCRTRLERDGHGVARISGLDSRDGINPPAADLPLDGRLDWFASLGLDVASAHALVRVDESEFRAAGFDPFEAEDLLFELRAELARAQAEYETVLARFREVEELYRRVGEIDDQIGRIEEERARRTHAEAMQAVRRLETEAARLGQVVASERAAAEAVLAAAEAAGEWRRLTDSLDVARVAFGQRPDREPDPETTPPAGTPIHVAADAPAGDGPRTDRGAISELEDVHRVVEEVERELDRVRMPGLAIAARRRLARAQRQEQEILDELGFTSWLAFQMRRVDDLMGPGTSHVAELRPGGSPTVDDPIAQRAGRARETRFRHALEEAEVACRSARERLETLLEHAGPPGPGHRPDDLSFLVSGLAQRAAESAVHRRMPPSSGRLREVESELAGARSAVAAFGRTDWDDDPRLDDSALPDTEPLLEERARLFEEAYRLEVQLPDMVPLQDRQSELVGHIARLESAARAGFDLKNLEEAEMVLLDRIAQAHRVGPEAEPIPLFVDDAFAAFAEDERHELLHLLIRLAETTQVVYLTADSLTLEWAAAQAGAGEAVVVGQDPPPLIASVA